MCKESVNILEFNTDCYFFIFIVNNTLKMHTIVNGIYGQLQINSEIEQVKQLNEIKQKFNFTEISEEFQEEIRRLIEDIEEILYKDKSLEELYEHKYLKNLYPKLDDEKMQVLGKYLDLTPKEAQKDLERTIDTYKDGESEYYIYTDEEANAVVKERIEFYLEIDLAEIPSYLHCYFDEELYISEKLQEDRGILLTGYQEICYGDYYIYRI